MPALALRFEEPTFRNCIKSYVAVTCRRYRVRHQDVDDLVQETLTNIVTSIDSFRPEEGEFEPWAKGVALNVIRRYSRDAKRYFDRFSEYYPNVHDYPSHESSPERCAQRKQARCSISNALEDLTEQQASVVVSFDIDDMSHIEIGNDLNITEAASHMCHKRAHIRLAQCLDRELLSVMPTSLTSCNDPGSSSQIESRWTERAHYAGQIIASIVVFLMFIPSCFEPQKLESKNTEARGLAPVHNILMYSSDELFKVQDEPAVLYDAPRVKPEPASLPSVRDVSAPTKSRDKLTYVQDLAPLPPYNPTDSTSDHHLRGR